MADDGGGQVHRKLSAALDNQGCLKERIEQALLDKVLVFHVGEAGLQQYGNARDRITVRSRIGTRVSKWD